MMLKQIINRILGRSESIATICDGWAARDRNGALFFHNEKPHRCYDCVWHTEWSYHHSPELFHLRLKDSALPELKWEDEPIQIELRIAKI